MKFTGSTKHKNNSTIILLLKIIVSVGFAASVYAAQIEFLTSSLFSSPKITTEQTIMLLAGAAIFAVIILFLDFFWSSLGKRPIFSFLLFLKIIAGLFYLTQEKTSEFIKIFLYIDMYVIPISMIITVTLFAFNLSSMIILAIVTNIISLLLLWLVTIPFDLIFNLCKNLYKKKNPETEYFSNNEDC